MDITLSEYAGDGGLSEMTMKALVTRADGDADNLAQMARPYGYTGGAALGVVVYVGSDNGDILSSRFTFLGEENPSVYEGQVKGKQLWGAEMAKEMKIAFRIGVRSPWKLNVEANIHTSRLQMCSSLTWTRPLAMMARER